MSRQSQKQQSRSNGQQEREKGERPIWSRRVWSGSANIEAAVFPKEITGDNGTFTAYNVSLKRTYKADEEYRSTQGFRAEDVPVAIGLLQMAYAVIVDLMNEKNTQ